MGFGKRYRTRRRRWGRRALAGLGTGLTTGNAAAAGAAANMANDLTKRALGDKGALDNIARDALEGSLIGPLADYFGPEVNGGSNFNPFRSPRTWGPKALQADAQEGLSDEINGAVDREINNNEGLAGRKDGAKNGCE